MLAYWTMSATCFATEARVRASRSMLIFFEAVFVIQISGLCLSEWWAAALDTTTCLAVRKVVIAPYAAIIWCKAAAFIFLLCAPSPPALSTWACQRACLLCGGCVGFWGAWALDRCNTHLQYFAGSFAGMILVASAHCVIGGLLLQPRCRRRLSHALECLMLSLRLCKLPISDIETLIEQAECVMDGSKGKRVPRDPILIAPFDNAAEERRFRTWYQSNAEAFMSEGSFRVDEHYERLLRLLWLETRQAQEVASRVELLRKRELKTRVFRMLHRTTRTLPKPEDFRAVISGGQCMDGLHTIHESSIPLSRDFVMSPARLLEAEDSL